MTKILTRISVFLILLIFLGQSCTPPVRLAISSNNFNDTLIIFTDDTLPRKYNKNFHPEYDPTQRLYRYTFFDATDFVVFKQFIKNCAGLRNCEDSVYTHLNIAYLKIISSTGRTYIAKNKVEIIELFEKGNVQGIVTF